MTEPKSKHWTLARDMGVLQLKLLADGFRDLMLVPLSLIAGIISLLKTKNGPGTEFYDLLRMGRRTERWIDLFGAADRYNEDPQEDEAFKLGNLDDAVNRLESFVVREYNGGTLTDETRTKLERALKLLRKRGINKGPKQV